MSFPRRVFVSMPADRWLSDAQNRLKWGIVERIEALGFIAEIFTDPSGRQSWSAHRAWSASDADSIMRRCHAAALIGLPRWRFRGSDGDVLLPTDFCHYEGSLARALGLPLLVLAQDNVMRRVVFDRSFGPYIGEFPEGADETWLNSREFTVAFSHWKANVAERRDVFLGYCGAAHKPAELVRDFLEQQLGVSVLDWRRDFRVARTILAEITEAAARCSAGVFLFTNDDSVADKAGIAKAIPRDNVVFEAGFFAGTKGKERVLVLLEPGTKVPADLGGDIYVPIDRTTLGGDAVDGIKRFIASM